jgi:hypothetical protein
MAAFVRDSYLDLTMVSRREAPSLESWASKLGVCYGSSNRCAESRRFFVLQSAVILVRVGAARKKDDPWLIRCTWAEDHETAGDNMFGACFNYFRIDMRTKLRRGQGANGVRRAERFVSATMDGERDRDPHQA